MKFLEKVLFPIFFVGGTERGNTKTLIKSRFLACLFPLFPMFPLFLSSYIEKNIYNNRHIYIRYIYVSLYKDIVFAGNNGEQGTEKDKNHSFFLMQTQFVVAPPAIRAFFVLLLSSVIRCPILFAQERNDVELKPCIFISRSKTDLMI